MVNNTTLHSSSLKLNKYSLLASTAISLKSLGKSTESAWMKVLQLTGNPYDVITRDDIEDIAIIRENEMEHAINNVLEG